MSGRLPIRALLAAVAAVGLTCANPVAAQPTLSESASILIAPKVIWDGSRDTLIELANTSNNSRSAFCFYLDGASGLQVNFDLDLAFQTPLRWSASEGFACPADAVECSFASGLVPPVPLGFAGALVCIEVDASGSPVGGNALAGGTSVIDLTSGDATAYDVIGLQGFDSNDGSDVLCLGADPSDICPFGLEYAGCPDQWILNHAAEGAEDSIAGSGSSVSTELTIMNCGADLFNATTTGSNLEIFVFNELEQRLSAQIQLDEPWRETSLADLSPIFGFAALGTTYAYSTITSTGGSVAIVAREIRQSAGPSPATASAGFSLFHGGVSTNDHAIVLPPRQ